MELHCIFSSLSTYPIPQTKHQQHLDLTKYTGKKINNAALPVVLTQDYKKKTTKKTCRPKCCLV